MTLNHEVSAAPEDITSALALTDGTRYSLEVVVGSTAAVRVWEGAAAPTDQSYFHTLTPGTVREIKPEAGLGIWMWRAASGQARVVVTEAP